LLNTLGTVPVLQSAPVAQSPLTALSQESSTGKFCAGANGAGGCQTGATAAAAFEYRVFSGFSV